jgi:putative transposase
MRLTTQTYSITTVTYGRRSLFQRDANAELMIETLLRYRDQGRYFLHAFVVMPDHVHAVITPGMTSLERCVQCLKGGFSHAVRSQFFGEVWQHGYHEHRIRDLGDYCHQVAYLAANPNRRGLIDYRFVHTVWDARLDPMPEHLRG